MNKIVLIGAGSTNFGLGTIGDIFKSNILAGSTIVLHDINADALKNSETIYSKIINLPMGNALTENDIQIVIDTIKNWQRES